MDVAKHTAKTYEPHLDKQDIWTAIAELLLPTTVSDEDVGRSGHALGDFSCLRIVTKLPRFGEDVRARVRRDDRLETLGRDTKTAKRNIKVPLHTAGDDLLRGG